MIQREHGSGQVRSRRNYAKRLNTELSRKVASAITTYAQNSHADVIVFEYLEMKWKEQGKRGRSFICGENGIFRSYANIRYTGLECGYPEYVHGIPAGLTIMATGEVVRDSENHSLCTFTTGKRYHCDLSAAYNIGSRYFIRELLKPLSATVRSSLEEKVPSVKRRTSCVYADLLLISEELSRIQIA
ncbi:MAG: hypothetical protein V8S36_01060 [Lachnospiraceae bacterium]